MYLATVQRRLGMYWFFNPSNAEATLAQNTRMQRILKTILTLSYWYPLESFRWILSDEYPGARVCHFSVFLYPFVLAKLATGSIRVNPSMLTAAKTPRCRSEDWSGSIVHAMDSHAHVAKALRKVFNLYNVFFGRFRGNLLSPFIMRPPKNWTTWCRNFSVVNLCYFPGWLYVTAPSIATRAGTWK